MAALKLVIGNKNYSSWSMRPWVLLKQLGIAFREVRVPLFTSEWDTTIDRWSPSRLVPVLWRGEERIWDSLAIAEAVNEDFPERGVWPGDAAARAFARSAAAEMHSGFAPLRSNMPMNIRGSFPGQGLTAEVRSDIQRIEALWREARTRFGASGPFLCGAFSVVDAMYAPVVMRFRTYGVALGPEARAYCEAMLAAPGVRAWMEGALQETEILPHIELYTATK